MLVRHAQYPDQPTHGSNFRHLTSRVNEELFDSVSRDPGLMTRGLSTGGGLISVLEARRGCVTRRRASSRRPIVDAPATKALISRRVRLGPSARLAPSVAPHPAPDPLDHGGALGPRGAPTDEGNLGGRALRAREDPARRLDELGCRRADARIRGPPCQSSRTSSILATASPTGIPRTRRTSRRSPTCPSSLAR